MSSGRDEYNKSITRLKRKIGVRSSAYKKRDLIQRSYPMKRVSFFMY